MSTSKSKTKKQKPTPAAKSGPKPPSVKLIMLVGLPGAGKSTFSKLFSTSHGRTVCTINQDEMGRKKCEQEFLREIKRNDVTILDRTNLLKSDRKDWIEMSMLSSSQILCVYLSTDPDECKQRANSRKNHPTVKFGRADRIVDTCTKQLQIPEKSEGYFDVITLHDEEDVRNYLKTWDCAKIEPESGDEDADTDPATKFHKFPRTKHLLNLGAASRDDLHIGADSPGAIKTYLNSGDSVDICEKIDGAQMGFSMDENYTIKVQNRSHYVNSKSHKQFKPLDKWLATFTGDLFEILQDPNHILFGEWMYAQHSISYTGLPNYFMAFDLYNKAEKKFYSRAVLEERCSGTEIQCVRLIYSSRLGGDRPESRKDLLAMMNQVSIYGEEQIEGLYVKINSGDYVKDRSKIVRADFIAGNEHWSKGIITANRLTNYF